MLKPEEEKILYHLQNAATAFNKLPPSEYNEMGDFHRAYRQMRNLVLARGGRRG